MPTRFEEVGGIQGTYSFWCASRNASGTRKITAVVSM